jgi:hypothetical protein
MCVTKRFERTGGGNRNDFCAGGKTGRYANQRILENHALPGWPVDRRGTYQKNVRVRLALVDVLGRYHCREIFPQASHVKHGLDILSMRRRGDRARHATTIQKLQ